MKRLPYGKASLLTVLLTSSLLTSVNLRSQTVLDVLTRQREAWNRGDLDGYMQGYWKSDSLLFTSRGMVRRGWTDILKKYSATYNSRTKMGTLRFSDLEVHMLSPESAWVFGHWDITRAKDHPGGVFTLILKKFPEGWKIVHDHTSSN